MWLGDLSTMLSTKEYFEFMVFSAQCTALFMHGNKLYRSGSKDCRARFYHQWWLRRIFCRAVAYRVPSMFQFVSILHICEGIMDWKSWGKFCVEDTSMHWGMYVSNGSCGRSSFFSLLEIQVFLGIKQQKILLAWLPDRQAFVYIKSLGWN